MGKKLVSRTAKVLSETKRRGGKEAIAIAYEHIPRDPEEQRHGSLYAVIELEDNGGHAEEIAERIIDILHDAYYDHTEKSSLDSFELALAKINEELADRSAEGQINWLGKLNAILGVLNGNTLHVTQAGKAEAYLYRGDHALHVTEDLSGDSINPARTFINVASGDLTEKDKLVLLTPGIFYKLSKNELKKYTTEASPKIAAENISRLLSNENGTNIPNALLIMEMISPEAFAATAEPETATETWVKDDRNMMEPVAEQTIAGTAKAFEMLGKAASGASTFISAKAVPLLKAKSKNLAQGFKKEPSAESVILESEERISTNLDYDGVLEKPKEDLSKEIRIRERDTRPTFLSSLEKFNLKDKTQSFGVSLKKLPLPKGRNSFAYLIGAVLILAVLGGFYLYQSAQKDTKVASKNTIEQARLNYQEAVDAIAAGDNATALSELSAAEKLAKEASSDEKLKSDAEKILADITKLRDQASGVVRNSAQELVDLGTETEALFTNGTLVYALDFETGALYAIDPKAGTKATLVEKSTTEGKIKLATYIENRNVFFLYTDANLAYELSPATKAVRKQNLSAGWEDATAVASFLTSTYLLSPTDNAIYKHLKNNFTYGPKTKYLKESATIADAVDLAIDSDVYVLNTKGGVQKFTSGLAQTFQIQNLPEPLTGGRDIYTAPDVAGLYIASADKIMKIDQNQKFVATYANDQIKNIQGIVALDKSNTLLVQSGGKIYTIKY